MAWKIAWSETAAGAMAKLDQAAISRLNAKLEQAAQDPLRFFSRLKGQDDFRLRAGDYRIIALLLHSEKVIFVEKIGHRKNIYKH